MKKQNHYAQPWTEFAVRWKKYYRPPGRPSPTAIRVYRRFTKKAFRELKRTPRTLVLGATPELRDLMGELKTNTAMIDIHLEMILAMTSLMKRKNPGEVVVRGDWCDMPFRDHYFDAVFGDIVLANIPRKKKSIFLEEVRRVLKPKGVFIQKMAVYPDDWQGATFEEVIEKFRSVAATKQHAVEFFCYLHNTIFDRRTLRIDTARIRKALAPWWTGTCYRHPSKNITIMLNNIWNMWKPLEKVWDWNFESNEDAFVANYFTIRDKVVLNDCLFSEMDRTFPIWFCQAK